MFIEVKGIGFPNKGAELMLAAIERELEKRLPEGKLAVEPQAEFIERSRFKLWTIARWRKWGINFAAVFGLIPRKIRHRFGIVLESELDATLDASGFTYGDQWGAEKAKVRLDSVVAKPLILMPQALGPFNDPELREVMKAVLLNSALVFARERTSLDYIRELSSADTIYQAPDFTNTLSVALAEPWDKELYRTAFIPNAKMLEMKTDDDAYIKFMAALLRHSVQVGAKPFLLIHEGRKDRLLGEQIIARANVDVPLIQPKSAVDVKAIIGQCELVVSSRFHGLVSALSQSVPVLATGWSHKYAMLLDDYGVSEYLVDERTDTERAKTLLSDLQNAEKRQHLNTWLAERASHEKAKTDAMWEKVVNVLKGAK